MPIETIKVGSRADWLRLRANDVTASVAGALFGVHPYVSAFSLFALKTGLTKEDSEETPALQRGRLLEPVAVELLREQRPGWKIKHNTGSGQVYLRDTALKIGATPDVVVVDESGRRGNVQIKTVEPRIFRDKWKGGSSKGEIEIPLWIVIQAIIEAKLTGADFACVAPMTVSYGVEMPILEIPLHDAIWGELQARVTEFWRRVETNEPPPPNYGMDGALIAELHAQDDGTTVDLSGDNRIMEILAQREVLKAREKNGSDAEKERKALDAEIIHKLGSAAAATLGNGVSITAKTTRRDGYEVKPSNYRTVRVKGFALPPSGEVTA